MSDKMPWEEEVPEVKRNNFVKEYREQKEEEVEEPKSSNISISLIKAMMYKGDVRDYCPAKVNATMIAKTHRSKTSISQLYGQFFETKAIGTGSSGQEVHDLPRKSVSAKKLRENPNAIGEKKIDQIRIEAQAETFKSLADKYKVNVCNSTVQIVIFKRWEKDQNVMLKGVLDIFPTALYHPTYYHDVAAIDLKFTRDLESEFGEYGWGNPANIDPIQGVFYSYLLRNIDLNLNKHLIRNKTFPEEWIKKFDGILPLFNNTPFYNWVFNCKEPLDNKFFPVKVDEQRIQEMHESIRKVVGWISNYEKLGYPTHATRDNCKNCPLSIDNGGNCKDCKDLNVI